MSDKATPDHAAKIAKLMAMATHAGSDPNEAAAAAGMAAALAAKYNISLEDVVNAGRPRPKDFGQVISEWHTTRDYRDALWLIGDWTGKLFGCQYFNHMWTNGSSQLCGSFTGQPHNVALAHSWFKYLWDACVRANTEHARTQKYGSSTVRQQARLNFRLYFANAVARRLKEKLAAMTVETAVTSTGTSLVVGSWFEQERKEVQAWLEERGKGDVMEMAPKTMKQLWSAAMAGDQAGKNVGLQDQIAGGATGGVGRIGS